MDADDQEMKEQQPEQHQPSGAMALPPVHRELQPLRPHHSNLDPGSCGRNSPGASKQGTPHAAGHSPHHNAAHHHHDPLEEQVFSPSFHLPTSSPHEGHGTPNGSRGGSAPGTPLSEQQHLPAHKAPPTPSCLGPHHHRASVSSVAFTTGSIAAEPAGPLPEGADLRPSGMQAAPAEAPKAPQEPTASQQRMQARSAQRLQQQSDGTPVLVAVGGGLLAVPLRTGHHAGDQHVRAIDLNVVDGIDVESEEDEETEAAGGTGMQGGTQGSEGMQAQLQQQLPSASAHQRSPPTRRAASGGHVGQQQQVGIKQAHVVAQESGTRGPTGSTGSGDIAAVGEELSSSDFDEYGHDENSPAAVHHMWVARQAAAATAATVPTANGTHAHDTVLVASAPRALAAAVAAAGYASAGGAAASALPPLPDEAAIAAAIAPEADEEEEEESEYLEFDPLLFIKQLPPLEVCVPLHRQPLLPRQTRTCGSRKTLVLDLDETLVHSSLEVVARSDFSFPVTFNGTDHMVFVRQRPHLHEFMVRTGMCVWTGRIGCGRTGSMGHVGHVGHG